jgi:hypothetical protein
MSKVKKYLAALAAFLGIAGAYGLGSADVLGKLAVAVGAAQAAADVVDPTPVVTAP